MAKVLSIPDVHGTHNWESAKSIPKDSYDYIVFHGDYFDSHKNKWPDQGKNFKAICSFVRKDTEHRKLLIGNHDWSYLSGTNDGSYVSGHQSSHFAEIRKLLNQNLDILDLAFECDGWIFSHAGFSSTWVQSMKKVINSIYEDNGHIFDFEGPYSIWDDTKFSIGFLNNIWHKLDHSYTEEDFDYSFDELLDWYGFFSSSGDEISQGPLWIRPESLLNDAYYPNQVVGHTEMCLYENVCLQQKENKIVFIDSPLHEIFSVFDTTADYKFITIPEFCELYNKTIKTINDIKSQIIYHKNKEKFIMSSLRKQFSENTAERLYRMTFKKNL